MVFFAQFQVKLGILPPHMHLWVYSLLARAQCSSSLLLPVALPTLIGSINWLQNSYISILGGSSLRSSGPQVELSLTHAYNVLWNGIKFALYWCWYVPSNSLFVRTLPLCFYTLFLCGDYRGDVDELVTSYQSRRGREHFRTVRLLLLRPPRQSWSIWITGK